MTTKTKRILLAEDEVSLRDFVSRNLSARGFEVLEAMCWVCLGVL